MGDNDGTSSHQNRQVFLNSLLQDISTLPRKHDSSISRNLKRQSILVVPVPPSQRSFDSEASSLNLSNSSARTSSSSSTSASNSLPLTRSCSISSASPTIKPCVTFAPLPSIEPRRSRRAGKLGVSGRAALLRQRIPRQQFVVDPDHANRNSAAAYMADNTYDQGGTGSPKMKSSNVASLANDEEDDAFVALGRLLNDASRTFWNKMIRKRSSKGNSEGGGKESKDTSDQAQDHVLQKKELKFDIDLVITAGESDARWEGSTVDPMIKTIREDSDGEDSALLELNTLEASSGTTTVEILVVNSPTGSDE